MEKIDSFFESLTISESSMQNTKNKQLDAKTSLYIRIIPSVRRISIIPSLVDGLSCMKPQSTDFQRIVCGWDKTPKSNFNSTVSKIGQIVQNAP